MTRSPNHDAVAAQLDEVLASALAHEPDLQHQAQVQRLRRYGTILLSLACGSVASIVLATAAKPIHSIGTLLFGVASILLLLAGAFLIHKAGKLEEIACSEDRTGLLDVLSNTPRFPSFARVHRKRQFGLSMLVLACFCVCVSAASVPGKDKWDVRIWAIFSVLLILVGVWQIHSSSADAKRAREMKLLAGRSKVGSAPPDLRRIK